MLDLTTTHDEQGEALASGNSAGQTVFITGATGYIGGRLAPALLAAGYSVRCLARQPRKLDDRPWRMDPRVSVERGDMSNIDELTRQLQGCSVAFYLVHSMEASGKTYAEHDRLLAANFATAAARAGVSRIIYLGGLGEMGAGLSQHLRSRREVESKLASTGVPVTTFRAAMIIGSGSASFEILRYLVERLPVMVTPSWVKTESQPVAITDVLHWLVRCLSVPETTGKTLEIGGPDVLAYRDLMQIMAEELHLPKRLIIPLPVLTPRLSSLWISLVTPVSYRIARPLGEGLRNRVVVTNNETQRLMPHEAIGVRESIRRALHKIEAHAVETRWSAAGPIVGDPQWAGGKVFTDQRSVAIHADPHSVFAAVCRIGGGNGWYAGDILWRIRGWMDQAVGGPGLRRGRRHPELVEFGEALDFWRVADIDRDRSLLLRAEMKLPGEALLKFDLQPEASGQQTTLVMTARFRPKGLLGLAYWYAVVPLHDIVFGGMLRGIRKTAEAMHRTNTLTLTANDVDTPAPSKPIVPGYGRARLWLGISAVGSMVVLAVLGLAGDVAKTLQDTFAAAPLNDYAVLLLFALLYALVQLPFDLLGGYFLPRRYQRQHPGFTAYLLGLARGVAVHTTAFYLAALALLFAGRIGGAAGLVLGGAVIGVILLRARAALAAAMAPMDFTRSAPASSLSKHRLPILMAESRDEGFTGAVLGVFRPTFHLLPQRWLEVLGPEQFETAVQRRTLAVQSGSWMRGRLLAYLFTLGGLIAAASMVDSAAVSAARGVIQFSLWFTLWSFVGLLTLPGWSRRGVIEVDELLRAQGVPEERIEQLAKHLDELQDAEPERPPLVEAIFHPIPSVRNRVEGPRSHSAAGYWDAARTSAFLSIAGLGLLGRAVHCNCGRPSLWVFLPTD